MHKFEDTNLPVSICALLDRNGNTPKNKPKPKQPFEDAPHPHKLLKVFKAERSSSNEYNFSKYYLPIFSKIGFFSMIILIVNIMRIGVHC